MIARSRTDNTAPGKTSETRSAALLRALQAVDLAGAAAGLRTALAGSERALAGCERALSAARTGVGARAEASPRASKRPRPRRRRVFVDGESALAPIPLARTAGMAAGVEVELVGKVVSQMHVDSRVPRVYHVRRF
jgi:hypothetical protein